VSREWTTGADEQHPIKIFNFLITHHFFTGHQKPDCHEISGRKFLNNIWLIQIALKLTKLPDSSEGQREYVMSLKRDRQPKTGSQDKSWALGLLKVELDPAS
jgi:hypothetical protein